MKNLPKTAEDFHKFWKDFRPWLEGRGSAILARTNPYEVARFTTDKGTGVVYQNAKGQITNWANGADSAVVAFVSNASWRAVEKVSRDKKKKLHLLASLIERDGNICTFCGEEMSENDTSIEHFVPLTSGGPDVLANMCLAHRACNMLVGHKNVRDKVLFAVGRWAANDRNK